MTRVKYKFGYIERVSVWQAFDGQCFWCGEPLRLADVTIDHVFPEHLAADPEKLERVKTDYRLPADWDVNSYGNWVPAHASCNVKKAGRLVVSSPAFLLGVDGVLRRSKKSRSLDNHWRKKRSGDRVLSALMAALENRSLTPEEIRAVVDGWPRLAPLSAMGVSYALDSGNSLAVIPSGELLHFIRSARSDLLVASPVIGEHYFSELVRVACRGVCVRLLIADQQVQTEQVVAYLRQAESANFEVRVLPQLHAKHIVMDDKVAVITSSNLTDLAVSAFETVFYTGDQSQLEAVRRSFEYGWAQAAMINAL